MHVLKLVTVSLSKIKCLNGPNARNCRGGCPTCSTENSMGSLFNLAINKGRQVSVYDLSVLKARFTQAVAELEFIGFIKSSKEKLIIVMVGQSLKFIIATEPSSTGPEIISLFISTNTMVQSVCYKKPLIL
ncbi:hypothetical protein NQ317_015913 [Molorchus minor]|uniref:Uncharacterized protein n=1 Tax=Molorchus minor TaxID=1323400 RepID=A0ABQ9J225_9CUCU|nr:hypothetical protein NQ317_015913 [Molorchus minor]